MKKEKVMNPRGEIIEVEVIETEEELRSLEPAPPPHAPTLEEVLALGHIPLEEFTRRLLDGEYDELEDN